MTNYAYKWLSFEAETHLEQSGSTVRKRGGKAGDGKGGGKAEARHLSECVCTLAAVLKSSHAEPVNVRPSWETLRSLPMIT